MSAQSSSSTLTTATSSSASTATSASSNSDPKFGTVDVVSRVQPLGFPFKCLDPFLFAVYHRDDYPKGNDKNMNAPVVGNGADFDWTKPFRMYHGERIPGFPQHPHRGFETITLVQEGTCDHTDSLGASGRYGGDGKAGDMQWMTAGRGCVHGENFPLLHTDRPNTLRLFQIWINLPKKAKMCPPGYEMYWAEQMQFAHGTGGATCEIVAGRLSSSAFPSSSSSSSSSSTLLTSSRPPPPHSWASSPSNDVGVFYIVLPPHSDYVMPPAQEGKEINRAAYVVEGATDSNSGISVGGIPIKGGRAALFLNADKPCKMENTHATETAHILVLQGRPIGEPVAQQGPFVMNTNAEIMTAYRDYQQTRFGGWPWEEDAVVFPRSQGRFAKKIMDGGAIVHDEPPKKTL